MSYAIIRNANYKKDNLAGLYKHNERKNTNYSNKDINHQKSINNYSIKKCPTTYNRALNNLIKEKDLKGRIIKTTNVVCEFIITSDKEFFDNIGQEETKRYFETAYNFVKEYQNLGEDYILSAKIHMDESTPHMHLVFVPVIHRMDKNSGKEINKIACSEYWKGKDSYRRLQDAFYKYISEAGFKLERGNESAKEHLSVEEIKRLTDYEKCKKEIERDDFKIVPNTDNKNTELVISQNKQLIKYVDNLKNKLTKQFFIIDDYINIKNENIRLKRNIIKLKKVIRKRKEYIETSFEMFSELFNKSIKYLKNLVNVFIAEEKIQEQEEFEREKQSKKSKKSENIR